MARNIKKIDRSDFENRLRNSVLFTDPACTADKYLAQIEDVTTTLLVVAPVRPVRCHRLTPDRQLSPEAVEAKQDRWRKERRWKSKKHEEDQLAYRKSCKKANFLINKSRNERYYEKIEGCGSNPRKKWNACTEILHPPTEATNLTPEEDVISDYFRTKIEKIKSTITTTLGGAPPDPIRSDPKHTGVDFCTLPPVTEAEVKKIISSMSCKSTPRDVVSTMLMKDCSSVFSVIITRLANLSFTEGVFPSSFKTAQISPCLKKSRPRPSCPKQLPTHI